MKTKQEIIYEILESGAKYVKTTISPESCAIEIAIRDIEGVDDREITEEFEWIEQTIGLDEDDY